MHRPVGIRVALAALLASAPAPGPGRSVALAITHGRLDDGDPGVVALLAADGSLLCTGTLVAPRVVVTAAHCVGAAAAVFFGATAGGAGVYRTISDHAAHPHYAGQDFAHDVGVVLLDEPAPPSAVPSPMRRTPLHLGEVGTRLRIVGYGRSGGEDARGGRKRQGRAELGAISGPAIDVLPRPSQSCVGDSGGPVFMRQQGSEVLVGIASHGDESCERGAAVMRMDVHAAFVRSFIDRAAEASTALGGRCYRDANCAGGRCLFPPDAPSLGYCTRSCTADAECPQGMRCAATESGGRCVHPPPSPGALGRRCAGDVDCDSGWCLDAATGAGVCTVRCIVGAIGCPKGFACRATAADQAAACFAVRDSGAAGGELRNR